MTPELKTSHIVLKPYYAGNVTDDHVRWLNDPEIVRFSEQRHKVHTLESIHKYVNDLHVTPGSHIWGIYLPGSPAFGTITAHVDEANGVANMGILIGERMFWGKGYGQEAWLMVCNWLFETGVRKIEAGCHYENRAMKKLAAKCGMTHEAVIHDHFVVDGKPQHLFLYAKMKPSSVRVSVDESFTFKPLWTGDSEDHPEARRSGSVRG